MAKIGIYGGSFNPPHLGHIQAARQFQEKLGLDQILFIPAAIPPHKSMPENSAGPADRLEMVRLAIANLPFACVDDLELRREGTSYTADTVCTLQARYPHDELYLCMGTDMFETFGSWYHPEEIAARARIVMAHRQLDSENMISKLISDFKAHFGASPLVLENDILSMSSTQIRRLLIFGAAEDYLDPKVLGYIQERGLFGLNRSRRNLPFAELRHESLALHKPGRVKHVIGCSDTAREMAMRFGVDPETAARAGILHDVTKALDGPDQLRLCRNYAIIVDDFDRTHTKLLHAITGAAVAREVFGESEEICQAIRWHTSGKANMTTLEKIIYVADYMEPNRDMPYVNELRRLAKTDLDEALLLGLQMTKEHLDSQGAVMGKYSVEAMQWLKDHKMTV